jgi:hypothetical protein
MLYVLYGASSYRALHKIKDIKDAFFKRGGKSYLVRDYDNENSTALELREAFEQDTLFGDTQLVVCKNVLNNFPELVSFLKIHIKRMSGSSNVYIFWERELSPDGDLFSLLKDHAQKMQEVRLRTKSELDKWISEEARNRNAKLTSTERLVLTNMPGVDTEWEIGSLLSQRSAGGDCRISKTVDKEPSILFRLADRLFEGSASPIRARIDAEEAGFYGDSLLNAVLWKLKIIFLVKHNESTFLRSFVAEKARRIASVITTEDIGKIMKSALNTESAMRVDTKRSDEHLDKFLFLVSTLSLRGGVLRDET